MCLCHNRFSTHNRDEDFLKFLPLRTLHIGTVHLDVLFFISVLSVLKCCRSLLDTTVIRVLPCDFRNFSYLTLLVKNSSSARCVSAASHVCEGDDIPKNHITSLKQILR